MDKKTYNADNLVVSEKIMEHSYQRDGVVAEGTELSNGAKQLTAAFPRPMYDKLKLAAEMNGVSAAEMIRQCVRIALEGGPDVAELKAAKAAEHNRPWTFADLMDA